MRTVYAVAWIAWLAAFIVIEGTALATGHPRFTLSDFVWRAEHVHGAWTALRFAIVAFCVWLAFHMGLGWFR